MSESRLEQMRREEYRERVTEAYRRWRFGDEPLMVVCFLNNVEPGEVLAHYRKVAPVHSRIAMLKVWLAVTWARVEVAVAHLLNDDRRT